MQINNIKATVLIYTIVLVNISLLMAVVMLNNSTILSNNREIEILDTKLTNNLNYKTALNIKYHKTLNSNGSGFIDTIACPATSSFTMSGSVVNMTGSISSGIFSCLGNYGGNIVTLGFESDMSDLRYVDYDFQTRFMNSGALTSSAFSNGAIAEIDSIADYLIADGIDDDLNSDNYRVNSTGSTNYPDGYGDDDTLARAFVYGYVSPDADLANIFWTNEQTNKYIGDNTNNDNNIYSKASTASGYIRLDLDKSFDIRVVEFDRGAYSDFGELRSFSSIEYSSGSGAIGYIQNDASLASSTGSAYQFDFPNKDYGIFINNTDPTQEVLFYQISAIDIVSGSGIYINPIKDDESEIIKILGNDILIDRGIYISKQDEIIVGK